MANTVPTPVSNTVKTPAPRPSRPNDTGTIRIESFVRISDPNTKKIYWEGRA
jgi:hypothetical protein